MREQINKIVTYSDHVEKVIPRVMAQRGTRGDAFYIGLSQGSCSEAWRMMIHHPKRSCTRAVRPWKSRCTGLGCSPAGLQILGSGKWKETSVGEELIRHEAGETGVEVGWAGTGGSQLGVWALFWAQWKDLGGFLLVEGEDQNCTWKISPWLLAGNCRGATEHPGKRLQSPLGKSKPVLDSLWDLPEKALGKGSHCSLQISKIHTEMESWEESNKNCLDILLWRCMYVKEMEKHMFGKVPQKYMLLLIKSFICSFLQQIFFSPLLCVHRAQWGMNR